MTTSHGLALGAAAAAIVAALSPTPSTAAVVRPTFSMAAQTQHNTLIFHGRRIVIGSAYAQAEALQRRVHQALMPPNPLFVADPSLNGVMVYSASMLGPNHTPYGILAGPQTQLNGPVAVSVGTDLPCPTTCTQYLYVSNAGNDTITYYRLPLGPWNQVPAGVISGNGVGCGPELAAPYGIVHVGPYNGNTADGQILQTSEANVSGSYFIVGWDALANGPSGCNALNTSPNYASPSGPSVLQTGPTTYDVFNANSRTVTETKFSAPSSFSATSFAALASGNASTEGTAVQASPPFVWVTTNANSTYTVDALWRCKITAAGPVCPATPVCSGAGAQLGFPDFPATSATLNRIFVPNQNNGTVTAYKLGGTCVLKATFVNLVTPIGTAVLQ
jgi:hypothetical protein